MKEEKQNSFREAVLVSVIMPVRNEARSIEKSLGSLLRQDYPVDLMEIIVADGMSTDATREIIGRIALTTSVPVTIVDNPKRIAPSGLNRALAVARGEVVVRVDGHCEVQPDYIRNCVKLLREGRADGVGGPIETHGETLQAEAIAMAMSSRFGVGGSAFRTINDREVYTDTVAFPGYTRTILEKAGPFNEELVRNQDDEYNFRIRKLGGRILLSPTIVSRYYSRGTFRSLFSQYFQYGYWKVRVLQLHPRQMSPRQFVPICFVGSLTLLAALSFVSTGFLPAFAALIAIYAAANVTVSILVARGRPRLVPLLFFAYAILHLSYGAGSACGLVAFWNGWGRGTLEKVSIGS